MTVADGLIIRERVAAYCGRIEGTSPQTVQGLRDRYFEARVPFVGFQTDQLAGTVEDFESVLVGAALQGEQTNRLPARFDSLRELVTGVTDAISPGFGLPATMTFEALLKLSVSSTLDLNEPPYFSRFSIPQETLDVSELGKMVTSYWEPSRAEAESNSQLVLGAEAVINLQGKLNWRPSGNYLTPIPPEIKKHLRSALIDTLNLDPENHRKMSVILIRTRANPKGYVTQRPHRDHCSKVIICCVDLENIAAPTTSLYTIHPNDWHGDAIYKSELKQGDVLVLNDERLFHWTGPIQQINPDKPAWRTAMVVTS